MAYPTNPQPTYRLPQAPQQPKRRLTAQEMYQADRNPISATNPTNAATPAQAGQTPLNTAPGYSNPDSSDEGDTVTNQAQSSFQMSPRKDGGDGDDGFKPAVEDPKAQQFIG